MAEKLLHFDKREARGEGSAPKLYHLATIRGYRLLKAKSLHWYLLRIG